MSRRDRLRYEFLPAALEIAETPPSPLGRLYIWMILIIVATAAVWSYLGWIDEMAVARGKIIPDGRLKVIQPLEEGMITAIHVNEGQHVKEGQLLVELDSTLKNVDVKTLETQLIAVKLEKEMLSAELNGIPAEKVLEEKKMKTSDLPAELYQFLTQLKFSKESEYKAREDSLKNVISQNEDQIRIYQPILRGLENKVNLLKEQERSLNTLYQSGNAPKMDWMTKQNELFTAQKDYEAQLLSMQQAGEKLKESRENLNALKKERDSKLLNQIVEKEKSIKTLEASLEKAQKMFNLQSLASPVEGTVHGLAVNTIGGVVTSAQAIATIVPLGTPLIIEATVLNKDIGFVRTGQEAEIKLDTFPFQKYGVLQGEVAYISPDAFEDEKFGLVYKIKVKLKSTEMNVDSQKVKISPGMSCSVEVKIGKRRVVEFFLSPIAKKMDESLKVR